MQLYQKFLSLSRGTQIALAVFSLHLIALLGLTAHHLATKRWKAARPLVVRTLSFPQPTVQLQAAPRTPSAPAPSKAVSAPPLPQSAPKKAPAVKKESAAKPKVAQAAPTKQQSVPASTTKEERLLKEIAASLETLTTEKQRSRAKLSIPTTKVERKAEVLPSSTPLDPTYSEYLIAFLQEALDLPEYGEVKAKLEIDRYGNLVHCEIIEAKSRKNADFLKNRLPELAFPCLNESSHTFTITFRNVEIH